MNSYIEDVARRAAVEGFLALAPDGLFPIGGYPGNDDERVNATWPGDEAALKANGVRYEVYVYPGTRHGFHNNSTPRYDEAAAKLAWERTIAFFKNNLA